MSNPRLFGTDGMRGKAGSYPLIPELLERLGIILASRIRADATEADDRSRVLMGHDGRESGETLMASLAKGLTRGGVDVDIVGLAPTPCIAYLTFSGPYQAGVVVSASHNPADDNGVKLLGRNGMKLGDALEQELETALLHEDEVVDAEASGEISRRSALIADYIGWLRGEAFPDLDLEGMRILVDCANGAASEVAPRVLHAFGAESVTLNDQPDGRNINLDCGALHPEVAAKAIVGHDCDLGLCVDGDADRGLLCDGEGRILDGDALLAGLGTAMQKHGELKDGVVVATTMSNLALERMLGEVGAKLERTDVGDRHVAERMREGGFVLGGEKSGHLLFGEDHGFRGDGIYTLLRVLQVMKRDGLRAVDFAGGYADLPQRLVNLPVQERRPLEAMAKLMAACRQVEQDLGDRGRTVVRFSGTELRLRLMVEATEEALVEQALQVLEAAAAEEGILT